MRTIIALAVAVFILWYLSDTPETSFRTLTVETIGLKNNDGVVRFFLYDSEARFLEERPIQSTTARIQNQVAFWELQGLPEGEYVITAFHDMNNNGELDRGFLKRSREPFGYSTADRAVSEAKSYERAEFYLGQEDAHVEVYIR